MTARHLNKPLLATVAATAAMGLVACGSDEGDQSSAETKETSSSGEYADGTYQAEGSYTNPGGTSKVGVELALSGGDITEVTVTPEASGTSEQFQKKFAGGIADQVVGKNIDDIDVDKVAGSSLTGAGFNQAIEQIKADASA